MACAAIDSSVSKLVALNQDGLGLELTFWIEAERCFHRLAAVAGDQRVELLESVEGAVDDPWPPSPPWQQVNAAPLSGAIAQTNLALLVGAAGASHWSASLEGSPWDAESSPPPPVVSTASTTSTPLEAGWRFDVACRFKSQPKWLGSTYRLINPNLVMGMPSTLGKDSPVPISLLELETEIGRYQLQGLASQENSTSSPSNSCPLSLSNDLVRLNVPVNGAQTRPCTVRWHYQLCLVS